MVKGSEFDWQRKLVQHFSGVLYILDEPSIGLHQRDNDRLIDTLKKLRDQGNTVVVVEHDIDTMRQADYIIDMGPAAGILGGTVTAVGTPEEVAKNPKSLTGAYLSGKRAIASAQKTSQSQQVFMTLAHAQKNNLKDITVKFPLGCIMWYFRRFWFRKKYFDYARIGACIATCIEQLKDRKVRIARSCIQ